MRHVVIPRSHIAAGAREKLAALMTPVATDGERIRRLVAAAEANGFEFDD
ncbi:hypothetical protein WEI85_23770 [Actinomycetes bacterium KLBMP 9797]